MEGYHDHKMPGKCRTFETTDLLTGFATAASMSAGLKRSMFQDLGCGIGWTGGLPGVASATWAPVWTLTRSPHDPTNGLRSAGDIHRVKN